LEEERSTGEKRVKEMEEKVRLAMKANMEKAIREKEE